jgi:hypothetical protein
MAEASRWARIFKVREKDNLDLWVAQTVIIVATVLGVYLAAQTGFRSTDDSASAGKGSRSAEAAAGEGGRRSGVKAYSAAFASAAGAPTAPSLISRSMSPAP